MRKLICLLALTMFLLPTGCTSDSRFDCIDPDEDGYGQGADCEGLDCAPDDASCFEGDCCMACDDADGDGYGVGPGCNGDDCDDADDACWDGDCCGADCDDADGDGYGAGADCLGADCDDADPDCFEGACCADCVDSDGDGYGQGPGCAGGDCDDADPDCFEGACCADCVDSDGDGYGQGPDCAGADCDDADPDCWQGACCNAQPLDCAGVLDCGLECAGDAGCLQACVELGDADSGGLGADVFDCMAETGCETEACLLQQCQPEMLACLDDLCIDPDGDGYGQGACLGPDCDEGSDLCWQGGCCGPPSLDCAGYLDCALACDLEDVCNQGCLEETEPGSRVLAQQLNACIQASGCQDEACLFELCWADVQACLGDQCTDADGDGYGVGANCLGPDCDDADPVCWAGPCCQADLQTCGEILDCAMGCDLDPNCMSACIAAGDPDAQALAREVVACAASHECADEACLFEFCAGELAACAQDRCLDPDGDGYGTGGGCLGPDCDQTDPACWTGACCAPGGSCADVLSCAMDCAMDTACMLACVDQGDDEAQALAQAVIACAVANACETEGCLLNNCAGELSACLNDQCLDADGDGYGEGAGCAGADCDDADPACWAGGCCPGVELTCSEVIDCSLGCGMDWDCIDACVVLGSDSARALAMAVWECANFHACEDEVCVFENCWAELQACLDDQCRDQDGDGYGHGDACAGDDCNDADPDCWAGACCQGQQLDCAGVLDCALGCNLDYTCMDACIQRGTPEAQALATAVADCSIDNACMDEACIFENCWAELSACLDDQCVDEDGDGYGQGAACLGPDCDDYDPTCQSGACCGGLDCPDIMDCALACAGDYFCITDCIDQGDPDAQALANDLLMCALENACQDQACLMTNCPDEVSACYAP